MPFTLEIDPVPADVSARVKALAASCGIHAVDVVAAEAGPDVQARVHLARAIALGPALLVLEHPAADLTPEARESFARDFVRAVDGPRLAALVITLDEAFARLAAHRVLRLDPATGALEAPRRGWFR